ncbi:MAG: hypothetical protein AB7O68_08420 [Pirellulales bacterium]
MTETHDALAPVESQSHARRLGLVAPGRGRAVARTTGIECPGRQIEYKRNEWQKVRSFRGFANRNRRHGGVESPNPG